LIGLTSASTPFGYRATPSPDPQSGSRQKRAACRQAKHLPACRRVTPIHVDDNRRGKRLLPAREWHCHPHMPRSPWSKRTSHKSFPPLPPRHIRPQIRGQRESEMAKVMSERAQTGTIVSCGRRRLPQHRRPHARLGELLNDLGAERRQVVGVAAGDEALVDHHFLVDPVATGNWRFARSPSGAVTEQTER
jgi:hypothetical protein